MKKRLLACFYVVLPAIVFFFAIYNADTWILNTLLEPLNGKEQVRFIGDFFQHALASGTAYAIFGGLLGLTVYLSRQALPAGKRIAQICLPVAIAIVVFAVWWLWMRENITQFAQMVDSPILNPMKNAVIPLELNHISVYMTGFISSVVVLLYLAAIALIKRKAMQNNSRN